jgi:hypothetical protein
VKPIETSIENIKEMAADWHASGKQWHFHMLLPGCIFNERQNKQAFVLENTSDGEVYVFYSDEPQKELDHALLLLLHGGDILDKDRGQADSVSDSIQPILRRAAELNEAHVTWHHHIFFPGCAYSQKKNKWAIAFEDPETGQVSEVTFEEQPVAEFRQIEFLFFDQDMFKT